MSVSTDKSKQQREREREREREMPEQTLDGATVVAATSFDSTHPPNHIVDG